MWPCECVPQSVLSICKRRAARRSMTLIDTRHQTKMSSLTCLLHEVDGIGDGDKCRPNLNVRLRLGVGLHVLPTCCPLHHQQRWSAFLQVASALSTWTGKIPMRTGRWWYILVTARTGTHVHIRTCTSKYPYIPVLTNIPVYTYIPVHLPVYHDWYLSGSDLWNFVLARFCVFERACCFSFIS